MQNSILSLTHFIKCVYFVSVHCRAAYIGGLSKHRLLLTNPLSTNTSGTSDNDVMFHLYVYAGLAGANSLLSLIRAFLFAYGGIEAAVVLHSQLLTAILKVTVFI